jgi:transposase
VGAPRIHGELLKLGFEIAESTVSKYMIRRRGPPSQTWRTFLRNYAHAIAAIDLCVGSTLTFECPDLSNDLGPSSSHQSCPDCIIATRGYDFRKGQRTGLEGHVDIGRSNALFADVEGEYPSGAQNVRHRPAPRLLQCRDAITIDCRALQESVGRKNTRKVFKLLPVDGNVNSHATTSKLGVFDFRDWPAPGSEDTELGVLMELEVVMERRKFTREFKLEAVRLIKDRGVSYVQASQDLGVHPSQLRDWVKKLADDPQHAFPGHGQLKPEQLEIARLKREVAKLKAERDILKKAAAYFAKEST